MQKAQEHELEIHTFFVKVKGVDVDVADERDLQPGPSHRWEWDICLPWFHVFIYI